jgi:hypothetical protein
MKVQRIYVDTSVIGGCADPEFGVWSNALMRDFQQRIYVPVTSDQVAAEVGDAPEFVRQQYARFLMFSPQVLPVTDHVINLAKAYVERQVLTPKFFSDGLHVALATIAEVDVLVSWNFKHIVHFHKSRLFNAVNLEQGYRSIQIYSPMEVATYEADE